MVSPFHSLLRTCALSCFFLFLHGASAYVGSATVSSTVLIFARDSTSAENGAAAGLRGYGIPFEIVTVPQAGLTNLPVLNSSETHGNYGGIVMISEVGYNYDNQYYSALTRRQWNDLYAYQTNFGTRMVRLDVFPTADFGVSSNGGNLNDEPVSFTNITGFPTAGLKANVAVSIANIFHSPATITNTSMAWEVAKFSTAGTAAVINQIGGRQQMVWFMPFALDWSASSNILQHAWIQWVTRGLYVGFRRTYLSTQVDDMFLETPMYRPAGQNYRAKPDDLSLHVDWQTTLNAKMPKGSEYFIEIGHNGNGDIEASTDTTDGESICSPKTGIEYPDQKDGNPEYMKPPGTGTDIWPATPTKYSWSLECAEIDELENWFAEEENRDAFAHISHTFSHADLTNATYADTAKEIAFNRAWLKQVGLDAAKRWSGSGLIPPAITGLHNADAIRGWMDNGIMNVVGDNTRPVLRNSNTFWPLNTTVELNGYAGLNVMPRWATLIYYNCDLPACTLQEWIDTSAGKGTFDDLMANARDTAMRNLFGLHWDPYMFHQANMRVNDVPTTSVNGKRGQYSLLMTWVEVITTEMMRLATWPFKTLKHDDLAQAFLNRQTRDLCRPSMTWTTSANGASIESVNVYTAGGNSCKTTIPITVPAAVSSTTGATKEQLGTDPLTLWVTMSGASRNYKFSSAIKL
ncbi:Nn.00g071030.m01.CDS01 [Neocucurbitaria sp. VM-36]